MEYYPIVVSKQSLLLNNLSPCHYQLNQRNSNHFIHNKTCSTNDRALLSNLQSSSTKDNSDRVNPMTKPKRRAFKGKSLASFSLNESMLLKENEALKLQIAQLIKENDELKEQNWAYSQQLSKVKLNSSHLPPLKAGNSVLLSKECPKLSEPSLFCPKSATPSNLFNQTPISFSSINHISTISCRIKKAELNQSIEAGPVLTQRTTRANLTVIPRTDKDTSITTPATLSLLVALKKRIAATFNKYNQKLTGKAI